MKIYPIAAESLGTRSFAHLVVTGSVNILIDPSVSLSPKRFSLKPLPIELAAAWVSRQLILEFAEMVDIIIQTHYHADHYTLGITRRYEFTNEEIFNQIYSPDVTILAKDYKSNLNYNQKKRAHWIWKNKKLQIKKADNAQFLFGKTKIIFSPPVLHGADDVRGCVVEVLIEEDDKKYIYSSDVCGPLTNEATNFIVDNEPDIVAIDGIPFYLDNYKKDIPIAMNNLGKILNSANEVYIDHHFLRSLDWEEVLKMYLGSTLPTFSMMRKQKPFLLEVRRKELFDNSPVEEAFYDNFFQDKYSVPYFEELLNKNGMYRYWKELREDAVEEIEKKRK